MLGKKKKVKACVSSAAVRRKLATKLKISDDGKICNRKIPFPARLAPKRRKNCPPTGKGFSPDVHKWAKQSHKLGSSCQHSEGFEEIPFALMWRLWRKSPLAMWCLWSNVNYALIITGKFPFHCKFSILLSLVCLNLEFMKGSRSLNLWFK